MAIYNLTDIMQANSTLEYLIGVNSLFSIYPILIAVAIFVVLLINISADNLGAGVMMSGFFLTTIMGFLWLSGYISFMIVVFSMIISLIGVLLVKMLDT